MKRDNTGLRCEQIGQCVTDTTLVPDDVWLAVFRQLCSLPEPILPLNMYCTCKHMYKNADIHLPTLLRRWQALITFSGYETKSYRSEVFDTMTSDARDWGAKIRMRIREDGIKHCPAKACRFYSAVRFQPAQYPSLAFYRAVTRLKVIERLNTEGHHNVANSPCIPLRHLYAIFSDHESETHRLWSVAQYATALQPVTRIGGGGGAIDGATDASLVHFRGHKMELSFLPVNLTDARKVLPCVDYPFVYDESCVAPLVLPRKHITLVYSQLQPKQVCDYLSKMREMAHVRDSSLDVIAQELLVLVTQRHADYISRLPENTNVVRVLNK